MFLYFIHHNSLLWTQTVTSQKYRNFVHFYNHDMSQSVTLRLRALLHASSGLWMRAFTSVPRLFICTISPLPVLLGAHTLHILCIGLQVAAHLIDLKCMKLAWINNLRKYMSDVTGATTDVWFWNWMNAAAFYMPQWKWHILDPTGGKLWNPAIQTITYWSEEAETGRVFPGFQIMR